MATPSSDGPWDFLSHGEDVGEFVDILRQLMQYLGYHQQPIFRGRMTKIMERESWSMEVFLYAREGEFIPHTFQAEHTRSRAVDAVQDTARFAATRLCQMHEDLLLRSPFCFFPALPEGEHYPAIRDARPDDPLLSHQLRLTQSLTSTAINAVDEIGILRRLLTSSYGHTDVLRDNLIRSGEAHIIAIQERDAVTQERDAAIAELARLTAASAITAPAPAPVPPPAIATSSRTLGSPLRPRGARTRMTARKSV